MNKQQKEVQQVFLDNEKEVLKKLKENYQDALDEINTKIEILLARQDADMQHVIYQVDYQKALKKQVQGILDTLQANEFETVSEYLAASYENGFIGTVYDMQGQGIPLVMPIDQEQVVKAIQHETKLSESLYNSLGKDIKVLNKQIAGEISRGISTGMMFSEISRNIAGYAGISRNKAMRIARTEGHRIQCKATMDACYKAKEKGADVVKQWDASLDGKTRPTHRKLDGQIRELDEEFEVDGHKAMMPSGFGRASEDINCRCALLQRAKWALDEDELAILQERAEYFGLDKTKGFEDFKKKYLKAVDSERVRVSSQKKKPINKNGEEILFEMKGADEKFKQSKELIIDLSNEYNTRLQKVTLGADKAAGDVDMYGWVMRLNSNKPNVAIHEFAHTLANPKTDKLGITHDEDFWKEIRKIKRQYHKDVDATRRNTSRWISSYEHSSDNINEFFAEAFTHAKMNQLGMDFTPYGYGSDLTYSNMVLEVVDKYFKKEVVEETLEKTVKSSKIKNIELPPEVLNIKGMTTNTEKAISVAIDSIKDEYNVNIDNFVVESLGIGNEKVPFQYIPENVGGYLKYKLAINKDYYFSDSLEAYNQRIMRNYSSGALASQNIEDLIAHEMAHIMTFQDCDTYGVFERMEEEVRYSFIKGMSDYADSTYDGAETIAEAFVRYRRGEELPDNVMELLDKYILGRKR